jgi:RNA 2',3'-cyclic 3'-phosphodiesterase
VRLFVAIDLDGEARQSIAAEQRRLAAALDGSRSMKWIAPAQMHLTLVFLGEMAEAAVLPIVEAMSTPVGIRPFAVEFGGVGMFPSHGAPRILWLGLRRGEALVVETHRQVAARLERWVPSALLFHPHLTLARWRTPRGGEGRRVLALDRAQAAARLTVDHINLYESRLSPAGPTYTTLARANLI